MPNYVVTCKQILAPHPIAETRLWLANGEILAVGDWSGDTADFEPLDFTDFTADNLARTIPNPNTRILIYCNNNFTNNRRPVVTKALPLALNIQTFINLYGYGYKNVWELGEAVDMDDPVVGWVSAAT